MDIMKQWPPKITSRKAGSDKRRATINLKKVASRAGSEDDIFLSSVKSELEDVSTLCAATEPAQECRTNQSTFTTAT